MTRVGPNKHKIIQLIEGKEGRCTCNCNGVWGQQFTTDSLGGLIVSIGGQRCF